MPAPTRALKLFSVKGINIKLDPSWIVIFLLISWSLAQGVFPRDYKGLSTITYWIMGGVTAIILFISILLHELGHSLVGIKNGMRIRGITLFIFGGVAELEDEPSSPKIELLMAIAGPIVSIVLAALFWGLESIGKAVNFPIPLVATAHYLWFVNLAIVIFNLVPGFPLDGGRVLRAIIWHFSKSISKATKITSSIGSLFGMGLIALGIFALLQGAVIAGIWYALIGFFLMQAAKLSYQRLTVETTLHKLRVKDLMSSEPISVSPALSIHSFVKDFCLKYKHHGFPVVEEERLVGFISLDIVTQIPQEEWDKHVVQEIMRRDFSIVGIGPNEPADLALRQMTSNQLGRLIVFEDKKVLGILSLRDLSDFLQLESEAGSK